LREAYRKAMADPELPLIGEDVATRIKAALNQPPKTVALPKEAMTAKAPVAEVKGTIAEYGGRKDFTLKLADGKTFTGEISGSRTAVSIAGQKADRAAVKVGMTCTVVADEGATEAKPCPATDHRVPVRGARGETSAP
jgi:translation initiation factor IF-1